MKPLRVVVVSEFPYKGVIVGGVQSAVEVFVNALSRREEIEAVLVVSFSRTVDCDEVVCVNDKLTVHFIAGQRSLALPTNSYFDYAKTKRIVRKFRPDVVHGQGTFAQGSVAVRLGYPSVVTIHGVGLFDIQQKERDNKFIGPARVFLAQRMIDQVIRSATVVITISDFDRAYCSCIRESNMVRIPNAIRQEFFETPLLFPESRHIYFGGVIIPRKNVAGLIRAFKRVKAAVPNAILDIAGPATESDYWKDVQEAIDPSVREAIIFHGNVKGKELSALMQRAAVCALFSVHENLPVVIAEAMALGKPIVASRVGAVAEMVEHGETGFLVESGDENVLADRLIELLNDHALRIAMGTKASERAAREWKADRVAGATIKAYHIAMEIKSSQVEYSSGGVSEHSN